MNETAKENYDALIMNQQKEKLIERFHVVGFFKMLFLFWIGTVLFRITLMLPTFSEIIDFCLWVLSFLVWTCKTLQIFTTIIVKLEKTLVFWAEYACFSMNCKENLSTDSCAIILNGVSDEERLNSVTWCVWNITGFSVVTARKIAQNTPIILKNDITVKKAVIYSKILTHCGGIVELTN